MLETRFPRLPGDIGNPHSFDFPTRYKVVAGASPARVVRAGARGLLEPFLQAAHALVAEGCIGITTTCGFLVLFQQPLADALPVPLMTSSLLQVPRLEALLPRGQRVGVITIDAQSLGAAHLAAAGAPPDQPVEGVRPDGELVRSIMGNATTLDAVLAEKDVVDAARRLVARCPEVGALVLECTNMPPYTQAVRRATGLPVHDALTATNAFWARLTRG